MNFVFWGIINILFTQRKSEIYEYFIREREPIWQGTQSLQDICMATNIVHIEIFYVMHENFMVC
jgi:hypothetical protein